MNRVILFMIISFTLACSSDNGKEQGTNADHDSELENCVSKDLVSSTARLIMTTDTVMLTVDSGRVQYCDDDLDEICVFLQHASLPGMQLVISDLNGENNSTEAVVDGYFRWNQTEKKMLTKAKMSGDSLISSLNLTLFNMDPVHWRVLTFQDTSPDSLFHLQFECEFENYPSLAQ